MRVRVKVEWGVGTEQAVISGAALDAVLREAAARAAADAKPYDVQITHYDAGTLGVVVGARRSVLNHVPPSLDPPYRISVGDEEGEDPFVFYVARDHYSEAAWRNTIPAEDALNAARHFARTGEMAPTIRWEEV